MSITYRGRRNVWIMRVVVVLGPYIESNACSVGFTVPIQNRNADHRGHDER
jgi:hypothetical protein